MKEVSIPISQTTNCNSNLDLKASLSIIFLLIGFISYSQTIFEKDGKYGIIGLNNEILLPNNFDTIYLPYSNEAHSYPFLFYVVGVGHSYGYAAFYVTKDTLADNGQGTSFEISDLIYDSIYWESRIPTDRGYASDELRNRSYLRILKNGKEGLIITKWALSRSKNIDFYHDIIGIKESVLIEPIYDSIKMSVYPNIFLDKKVGIFFSESEIIQPVFDSIKRVHELGDEYFYWVNGNCGLIKRTRELLPPKYFQEDIEVYTDNSIHIVSEGDPFTVFSSDDMRFITFKNDETIILNHDSVFLNLDNHYTADEIFFRLEFKNMNHNASDPFWFYDRVIYADSETGLILKDYQESGCFYQSISAYLFRITFKRQKLKISMIEPISGNIICNFKTYYTDNEWIELTDWGTGIEILTRSRNGDLTTVGFVSFKDHSFSKKNK